MGTFEPFLKRLDLSNPETLEIASGGSWVNVHPLVLAMIAALGSKVDPKNVHLENFKTKSYDDFARMGFFRMLGVEPGRITPDQGSAGKFIPITQIRTSDELSGFLKDMIPLLHLDPGKSELIYYVMSELGRNVLEHARTGAGAFFAAEFYKDQNTIRLGIADVGIGLRASLMRSHAVRDDLHAIQLALTPGITGTTAREGGTEQNAGAGLFFIKSISSANRNFMIICSGDSMYKLLKRKEDSAHLEIHADPFEDNHSKDRGYPAWPGTAVGMDITLDPTVDFTEVMDLIRAAFADAVRERKKLKKYKQPRFI